MLPIATAALLWCLFFYRAACTSVLPGYSQLPVVVEPGAFHFATACNVGNCSQCSFDSAQECTTCSDGFFAFKYSYDVLAKAPMCLDCGGLGCAPGTCADQQGCGACSSGSVLTVDFGSKSSPKGNVVTYALPARCQRCTEDLKCMACEDWTGCTVCPPSYIRFVTPGTTNYTRCVSCKSLGCSSCEDGVGCTACPAGSFLYTDGDDGAGLVRCKSCADQHCSEGWCTDNWGCSDCPVGYVLSRNLTVFPYPPLRCLSCTADLHCLECDGTSGCKLCPPNMYLKQVTDGDLYPRTECASCTELGCATCDADKGCLTCNEGYFLDTSTAPNICRKCSSVFNCGSCGEAGCDSCSAESYLTNSLVYPGRKECARCQGCRSCSAKAGCDSCLPGYFKKPSPAGAAAQKGACLSCSANNCELCQDGKGCTSCVAGTYLYNDTQQGIMTCRSCSDDLNCDVCGEKDCKSCPFGYYRCRQTLAPSNQSVTGCCPCTGCAKCQDFKGCTACPYNYTLTELPSADPFNTCQSEECIPASSCNPCNSDDVSGGALSPDLSGSGSSGVAASDDSKTGVAAKPQQCNTCPAGQFLADPSAPFLDCRDCSTWLGCSSCGMQGCTACPTGAYLTTGTSTFGANVTTCTACSGCRPEDCMDNFGCQACPGNFSMSYGTVPFRRCYDCGSSGLNCAACSKDVGCTACPEGYFLDRPSDTSPWYCSPCQLALGCTACDQATGCTDCPKGYTLAKLGQFWGDVASCTPVLSSGGSNTGAT